MRSLPVAADVETVSQEVDMTEATKYSIHLEPEFDSLDQEGEPITLEQHQGYTIPRGVVHRTRAPERTAVLMVEKKSVRPTGDA
jgi:hypothetical protein